ncbi:fumarylacetoacetate hydrolase family protein [Mesorhizobium sp. M0659]|uniref:fumarylacetoacetate hydrolase family protein n=1 Tax=Mesorhizobium sp. M0659 TaxID=2956980 RepID=UPI00333AE7DD
MRYITCRYRGAKRIGTLKGDAVELLMQDEGDMLSLVQRLGDDPTVPLKTAATVSRDEVELLAPMQRFRRDILCTGWNYWDHFEESRGKRDGQDVDKPAAPTFFTKAPDTAIGPTDPIAYDPYISAKWDYEVELGLVIGKTGRSIARSDALSHVFGYFLANDVSQRDLQRRHGGQWLKGKSIDGTMPMGPVIVTPDELNVPELRLQCSLNGRVLQDALVKQMAFPIEELIAELSFGMTLHAGDVLITGTPSGIGNAREPQIFLQDGDEVVSLCRGLGELRNVLVARDLHGATSVPSMSVAL